MKIKYYFFLLFLFFFNCAATPLSSVEEGCPLCREMALSKPETAHFANGRISVQNQVPREEFDVVGAAVVWIERNIYSLTYLLDTGDTYEIIFAKCSKDFNYHFPRNNTENKILEIFWNNVSFPLRDAALSLQPQRGINFTAIINIHSLDFGDWQGTVREIPLLEVW
ncbi:MAG: hypothetical protein AAF696_38200 [Bacteroidota bacterium]